MRFVYFGALLIAILIGAQHENMISFPDPAGIYIIFLLVFVAALLCFGLYNKSPH